MDSSFENILDKFWRTLHLIVLFWISVAFIVGYIFSIAYLPGMSRQLSAVWTGLPLLIASVGYAVIVRSFSEKSPQAAAALICSSVAFFHILFSATASNGFDGLGYGIYFIVEAVVTGVFLLAIFVAGKMSN